MNTIVKATITDTVDFGAFAIVEYNGKEYKGLIHISEIANQFVRNAADFVSKGDVVDVMILEINEAKSQMKLSIKKVNN